MFVNNYEFVKEYDGFSYDWDAHNKMTVRELNQKFNSSYDLCPLLAEQISLREASIATIAIFTISTLVAGVIAGPAVHDAGPLIAMGSISAIFVTLLILSVYERHRFLNQKPRDIKAYQHSFNSRAYAIKERLEQNRQYHEKNAKMLAQELENFEKQLKILQENKTLPNCQKARLD